MKHSLNIAITRNGFRAATYVPCSRFKKVFDERACETLILASREEEAIATGCGLALGGVLPIVLMQSSGLLNSLNCLGSLAVAYRIPLVCLISMRGGTSDHNLTQRPVGNATRVAVAALGAMTMTCTAIDFTEALSISKSKAINHRLPCVALWGEN
ncbi:hypothetical protein A0J51_02912 [Gluconobacter japonicus]|nr:hypothetical protein A0J51_02912 [Gluconobacter japonicus]